MAKTSIEMHDILPIASNKEAGGIVRKYMPGFSMKGGYQFTPKAGSQEAAIQLNLGMQNGPHKWLNEVVEGLIRDLDGDPSLTPAEKTVRMCGLYNYLTEANKLGPDGSASCRVRDFTHHLPSMTGRPLQGLREKIDR